MTARQSCADCSDGHLDMALGEIHHHLARIGNLALAALGKEFLRIDVVVIADFLGNDVEIDSLFLNLYGIAEHRLGKVDCNLTVEHGSMGKEGHYDSFKFAYTVGDIGCNIFKYFGRSRPS